jgi:predicted RNA-binding Zn ribbon-like protein
MSIHHDSLRSSRLSIDLTWTLRYRNVSPTEFLNTPDDLRSWTSSHGLKTSDQLRYQDLARFRELREAIFGALSQTINEQRISRGQRQVINKYATHSPYRPSLLSNGSVTLEHDGTGADEALSTIARDAIELLALNDGRLRRCEGPGCALIFHDESRPGTRRWCDTSRCGNRVNTHSYRKRRASLGAERDSAETMTASASFQTIYETGGQ